jgi:hypothetical protein
MSKATDMLTTMGGLRGPAAAPKGASHGADDMNATVRLLRAMARGSDYKERKHDIILTAGADEIERLRAIREKTLGELEDRTIEVHALRAIRDELLAALEAAQEHVGLVRMQTGFNIETIREQVRAAIAKAKEQQP